MLDIQVRIRIATPADAPAIASIYSYYVYNSVATFEIVPPTTAEIAERLAQSKVRGLDCLVCETEDGEIVGYAYGRPFNAQRPAYDCAVELTVYLRHEETALQGTQRWTGKGLGRQLVTELIKVIRAVPVNSSFQGERPASQSQRYLQLLATESRLPVINKADGDTIRSFYRALGFRHVGTFVKVGYKMARWVDVDCWQLDLCGDSV